LFPSPSLVGFFGDGVFALFSPVLSFDWRLEGCSCRKKMAELIKLEKKKMAEIRVLYLLTRFAMQCLRLRPLHLPAVRPLP
jgi:hypothetical protein